MKKIIVSYADMHKDGHKHAMNVIKELNITYRAVVPQPLGECWIFYGCENIPEQLPASVSVWDMNDRDFINSGIRREVNP
ncbi:hypothetical protein SPM19_11825 [Enterobacter hormaechei subsp. xiangfangensis]|mgnify:CR=1 FL=1|uniref:hypothetical protein n=1 Tax=Enterobacter TaxID=547 RepID=UPI0013D7ECF1|nr:hypothetical protein [Enterobacter hormaechei]MCU3659670.1 hypothetical protein [Enterobacter hormaechei subsp. steigerwaltii]HBM2442381.1 hypothetical protein [Enterobacter hormaechei subsp. xiangfangensis]ELD3410065.1 hypothetical protein [Enterobacter hormaechei]MCO7377702.1 hypothetical protein [Enterobacter hormaechei]MCU3791522.1 hypothetical protein [Enterobacter hormaechei subsp. steigerwaltii]